MQCYLPPRTKTVSPASCRLQYCFYAFTYMLTIQHCRSRKHQASFVHLSLTRGNFTLKHNYGHWHDVSFHCPDFYHPVTCSTPEKGRGSTTVNLCLFKLTHRTKESLGLPRWHIDTHPINKSQMSIAIFIVCQIIQISSDPWIPLQCIWIFTVESFPFAFSRAFLFKCNHTRKLNVRKNENSATFNTCGHLLCSMKLHAHDTFLPLICTCQHPSLQ